MNKKVQNPDSENRKDSSEVPAHMKKKLAAGAFAATLLLATGVQKEVFDQKTGANDIVTVHGRAVANDDLSSIAGPYASRMDKDSRNVGSDIEDASPDLQDGSVDVGDDYYVEAPRHVVEDIQAEQAKQQAEREAQDNQG